MNVSEYLMSLGATADAVADSLRAQGIKGIKVSTCAYPIVNAIYKACPDYWAGLRIYGSGSGDHRGYGATLDDDQICDPQLPRPVQDFIARFDRGDYPDLIATKVRQVTTRVWE
jgi:hypothetical protein